jgi:hypothetical protein
MSNMALAAAFALWLESSTKHRNLRNKCIQIVQKMLHRGLAKAFDGFAAMVEEMRNRRFAVQKSLARWRTPYAQKMFERWIE